MLYVYKTEAAYDVGIELSLASIYLSRILSCRMIVLYCCWPFGWKTAYNVFKLLFVLVYLFVMYFPYRTDELSVLASVWTQRSPSPVQRLGHGIPVNEHNQTSTNTSLAATSLLLFNWRWFKLKDVLFLCVVLVYTIYLLLMYFTSTHDDVKYMYICCINSVA